MKIVSQPPPSLSTVLINPIFRYMYARKYKKRTRRSRFGRRRQYRRRPTIYRRKRNIKRRLLKYRCHSERFISNGTWNSSYTGKPVVITTRPSNWSGWGNLKKRYMEYQLTCFKIEMLPKQSAGLPKLQSDHSTHLPTMCSRYCDRPLSTTTSLEQYQDVRKTLMNRYKKWIIKYPKYNWNDSTGNLYISNTRWLPTSSSQGFYGIAF